MKCVTLKLIIDSLLIIYDLNLRHHNAVATAIEGDWRQGEARRDGITKEKLKKFIRKLKQLAMRLTMHFIEFLCQTIWSTFPIKCHTHEKEIYEIINIIFENVNIK